MNNKVTERKGFFISYNPNTAAFIPSFAGDGDGEETAIVKEVKGDTKYYILNGDHRKKYEKCKTFKECMDYFKKNKSLKSSWSD